MDVPVKIRRHLVLVGGGHSHVEVLRDWAREPVPGGRVTVAVGRPTAVYSGMGPGLGAGGARRDELQVDVVGAGAGGVELAFAFSARFAREGLPGASVQLLESGPRVLAGYPDSAMRRIERNARARGIAVRCGARVAEARADRLMLEGGE